MGRNGYLWGVTWGENRCHLWFHFPPLNQAVVPFHASAVQDSVTGKAIVFVGVPYQGKSTLANSLLLRGNPPLADNLAVFDVTTKKIRPYLTPTGVREDTLDILPEMKEHVQKVAANWITISEVTATVYLLHFDDIYEFEPPVATSVALIVHLCNLRNGSSKHAFTELDCAETISMLSTFRVRTGSGHSAVSEILDHLAKTAMAVRLEYSLDQCNLEGLLGDLKDMLK